VEVNPLGESIRLLCVGDNKGGGNWGEMEKMIF